MVRPTGVAAQFTDADEVVLEDLGGRFFKVRQERLFDGHGDPSIFVHDVVPDPAGFVPKLSLVRRQIQPQHEPKQDQHRYDSLYSIFGRLYCDNRAININLNICFKAIQQCLTRPAQKRRKPAKKCGAIQAALAKAQPDIIRTAVVKHKERALGRGERHFVEGVLHVASKVEQLMAGSVASPKRHGVAHNVPDLWEDNSLPFCCCTVSAAHPAIKD